MHTNHRRKNRYRSKHFPLAPSLKEYQRRHNHVLRARVRDAIARGRYDDIVDRDPRCHLWNYW